MFLFSYYVADRQDASLKNMKLDLICVFAVVVLACYVDGRPPAVEHTPTNKQLDENLQSALDGFENTGNEAQLNAAVSGLLHESSGKNVFAEQGLDGDMDALLKRLEQSGDGTGMKEMEHVGIGADLGLDLGGYGDRYTDDRSDSTDLGSSISADTLADSAASDDRDGRLGDYGDPYFDAGRRGTSGKDFQAGRARFDRRGGSSSIEDSSLQRALSELGALEADDGFASNIRNSDSGLRDDYSGDASGEGSNSLQAAMQQLDNLMAADGGLDRDYGRAGSGSYSSGESGSLEQLRNELRAMAGGRGPIGGDSGYDSSGDDDSYEKAMSELAALQAADSSYSDDASSSQERGRGYLSRGLGRARGYGDIYSAKDGGSLTGELQHGTEYIRGYRQGGRGSAESNSFSDSALGSVSADSSLQRAMAELADLEVADGSSESSTGYAERSRGYLGAGGNDDSLEDIQAELAAMTGESSDELGRDDDNLDDLEDELAAMVGGRNAMFRSGRAAAGSSGFSLQAIERELADLMREENHGSLALDSTGTNAAGGNELFGLLDELNGLSLSSAGESESMQGANTGAASESGLWEANLQQSGKSSSGSQYQQSSNSQTESGHEFMQKFVEDLAR